MPAKPFLFVLAILIALGGGRAEALTSGEIDRYLENYQKQRGIESAPAADDGAFLRRLSLDVRGAIPSIEETIAFLDDTRPDKRARVVEEFLLSEERGEQWAIYWEKVLIGVPEQPANPMGQYLLKNHWRDWAADEFNANRSFDQFMKDVLTARGTTRENPETLPIVRWRENPENAASTFSRAFLGIQIQCAQCHDHKENPALTQEKFWEYAAFFSQTRAVPVLDETGKPKRGEGFEVIELPAPWTVTVPGTNPPMQVTPKYLDGTPAQREIVDADGRPVSRQAQRSTFRSLRSLRQKAKGAEGDPAVLAEVVKARQRIPEIRDTRREQLAMMMAYGDEDQFAVNFVNRLWARYFGRGLLEPVDAWMTGTVADHPELLRALASEFRSHGYDIRHVERLILNTRAYQRSSAGNQSTPPESFAVAVTRPLSPDQILTSFVEATAAGVSNPEESPRNMLATLRNRNAAEFIFAFQDDEMEWKNTFETSVPRSLFLLNDEALNRTLQARRNGSSIDRIVSTTDDTEQQIDYLYLAALSRLPTNEERTALAGELRAARAESPREAEAFLEDALWALLNGTEFLTNH